MSLIFIDNVSLYITASQPIRSISTDVMLLWKCFYCMLLVDRAVNLGALVLHALFEHWPSTHPQVQEVKQVEKGNLTETVV